MGKGVYAGCFFIGVLLAALLGMSGVARAVGEKDLGGKQAEYAETLPVVFYNELGQKILIRYGAVYEPEGDLMMSLPAELFEGEKGLKLTIYLEDLESGECRERTLTLR